MNYRIKDLNYISKAKMCVGLCKYCLCVCVCVCVFEFVSGTETFEEVEFIEEI